MTNQAIEWLFAGGGALAIGMGLRWLWAAFFGRLDKREADIKAREDELEAREAERVRVLNERVAILESNLAKLSEDHRRVNMALTILIAKELRLDPDSAELKQVTRILADGKVDPGHE